MKLRHFMAVLAAISFLFVLSTQDLYASHTTLESIKKQKEELNISEVESDIHIQLLKNDLILGNEDGGGYYRRYDYTWLWITLIVVVVLVVIMVVAYSSDWWYWY
ncbi:MAG: hypothetical protein KAT17_07200 [Candidatus Aminicenantes bacterium]|nr:hypothetical protein [Candidatus Aminicenantes bacterium]